MFEYSKFIKVTSLQQALTDGDQPLIYLDGMLVPNRFFQSADLENLDPDEIESIELLSPDAAVRLYGEKASAGVVQIRTKRD